MVAAQADADARWNLYEQMAGVHRTVTRHGKHDADSGNVAPATAAPSPKEEQS
jgi:hypothetical protein